MQLLKLGKYAKTISGYAFKSEDFLEEGVKVIKISNIGFGEVEFDNSNTQYVDENFLNDLDAKFKVSKGDILISLTGSHISQPNSVVGKVALYNSDEVALLNQRAGKIVNINKEFFEPRYLFYVLSSPSIRMSIALMAHGAASQANVSPKDIDNLKLFVPNVNIQTKIAGILSAYDELIENNKKRIALLETMAEELYKEWFVRFRFPNYENTEFEKGVPKSWNYSELGTLGSIRTGKTPLTNNTEFYGGEFLFYKTPDMHDKYFVFETEQTLTELGMQSQKSQIIQPNSIMVTCIGTGGVTAISTKLGCTNQQINSLTLKDESYLEWAYLMMKDLKPQIEAFGATGATMTNLSKTKFSNLKVLIPNNDLILKFHEKIKPVFDLIKQLTLSNANLNEQKNQLLPRLISGKLSVEHLNIQQPPTPAQPTDKE